MFKRMKKITASALSCVVLVGTMNLQVFAGSSISGTFPGTTTAVSGHITMNSSSATAVTTFVRGGGTRYVVTDVFYWWGNRYYASAAQASTGNTGGISATATKKYGGADVIGGNGSHRVVYNGTTWGPYQTTIGNVNVNVTVI